MSTTPSTPRKRQDPARITLDINTYIGIFQRRWDLQIKPTTSTDSPMARQARLRSEEDRIIDEIVSRIRYLYHKSESRINCAVELFNENAHKLYSGWVYKKNAEGGVIPERQRNKPTRLMADERMQMLQCLRGILAAEAQKVQSTSTTPSFERFLSKSTPTPTIARSVLRSTPNDAPITISITPTSKLPNSKLEAKRSLEGFADLDSSMKKAKQHNMSHAHGDPAMPPPKLNNSQSQRPRTEQTRKIGLASANTSFATTVSSVFSQQSQSVSSTQETEPDIDTIKLRGASSAWIKQSLVETEEVKTQSSEHWGSSLATDDLFELDALDEDYVREKRSYERLDHVFQILIWLTSVTPNIANMPTCLNEAPIFVAYEIVRVLLFTQVPMDEFDFPYVDEWLDYDVLWGFLRRSPVFRDKKFPERCEQEAWNTAKNGYKLGFRGVVFAASLCLSPNNPVSLFSLKLQPLKLDYSHRLERRFGNDRFLELEVPNIEGRTQSHNASKSEPNVWQSLIDWLVDADHQLLGRTWKAFFVKPKEDRKGDKKKRSSSLKSESDGSDASKAFRVYLFATDGIGISKASSSKKISGHVAMKVQGLLDCIRPTQENSHQPYTKLFARTALALSRNSATVTLERSQQIRYRKDIKDTETGSEDMTDGAGRMSRALAEAVADMLELGYRPTAFQGRFGEAKGLWTVDHDDHSGEIWIELFKSQCKWVRSKNRSAALDHPSNRTFEVVNYSTPLKSADLNTQLLPILENRTKKPRLMRDSICQMLEEGLNQQVETLIRSLETPQALRAWVPSTNASIQDRLKEGAVAYRAGLPAKLPERLNLLLDAGFDPQTLFYMKELARAAFKYRCEELKERLNITVSKSTYVYMIPDFWGVLEPNEVYLDLSSFVDNMSKFPDKLLKDVDVLVARNPAHYASDIQRVTAVCREQFVGLRDVIVFSTKGKPSLAAKLSGGDYDGDMAWVCWDNRIVDIFENAEVPSPLPDLVKEGFIIKDSTKYSELVRGHPDPASIFLRKSFEFNMRPSMLGICTSFKEDVAYKYPDLNSKALIFLSTLLSKLVDQAKQGFIFGEPQWQAVRKHIIATTGQVHKPKYKLKEIASRPTHILDWVVKVAHVTTERLLTDFHQSIKDPPQWDDDLAKFYSYARRQKEVEWKSLLDDLDKDIEDVKLLWDNHWGSRHNAKGLVDEETRPEFGPILEECFEKYKLIRPRRATIVSRLLLSHVSAPDCSQWELLKASALFASYSESFVSKLVWWMAGRQYAHIKAQKKAGMVSVAPHMYAMLKANTTFVKQLRAEKHDPEFWENAGATNALDVDFLMNDD
ncbi:hypothetical protein CJF32_00003667 [Rutstroemia sp. NJR-2017a WRK4]|nr:hypothetical protein CJF32_00003667 [Rutstroemia sp. NJR-2017a WRK4]